MMLPVLMAYVDETGDTGDPSKTGSSGCYALGCLVIKDTNWPGAFDQMIDFRRRLRDTYGLPTRAEVKANHLIRGGGALKPLGLAPAQRGLIYRAHLQMLAPIRAVGFAVVIDKQRAMAAGRDAFEMAWETLLQRLERTSSKYHEGPTPLMITHDAGEDDRIRKLVRHARRRLSAGSRFGTGTLKVPMTWLVDDPIPRDSQQSYFVQMADLLAYAGWRTYVPPSANVAQVVPATTWNSLGNQAHRAVNMHSGGVPGVVVR